MTTRKIGKGLFSCLVICLLIACGISEQAEATIQPEEVKTSPPEQSGSAWVETLSAEFSHTCRVKDDGTIDCWGNNFNGQASPPEGMFTQVSVGYVHGCGLKSDGTVDCWGWMNNDGQVTSPVGEFTQISAGEVHNCGVKSDGTIVCWGNDYYGQSTPPAGTFIQISAGGHNTCGVKNDGTLACWGYNDGGQATPPGGRFTQVSVGGGHTCGVKSDGTLACWGANDDGQSTPPEGTFIQVSAGYEHTCGVKSDGTVACWGYNDDGQSNPPSGTFTQVSAGNTHTCGMMSNGSTVCWGDNTESQSSPYTIYGNAGAYWATLSYNDGSLKAVTSDGGADYSINVPYNWSGTVTPSRAGYTITPLNREYVNVTADQINQDYTAYKSYADVLPYDSIPGDGCSFALFAYIETLHDAGFTAGCLTDPPRYCPNNTMTRAEAAVFMLRGNSGTGYAPPDAPWDTFADDWSPGPWAEKWAEGMWQEGMTAGCMADPLRFCPWDQFTRLQAAVLGLRLKYGMNYTPPPASGEVFTDMTDVNYWGTRWAEQAYLDGLLPGCGPCGWDYGGPKTFCPDDPLTRAWGAYLIVEAKDLPLIIP
jgi:alpha-tubulin suppressor-like RCC1 family protein